MCDKDFVTISIKFLQGVSTNYIWNSCLHYFYYSS